MISKAEAVTASTKLICFEQKTKRTLLRDQNPNTFAAKSTQCMTFGAKTAPPAAERPRHFSACGIDQRWFELRTNKRRVEEQMEASLVSGVALGGRAIERYSAFVRARELKPN
ncbi:hypothetical protein C8R47DRAFT_1083064 [Mycena vitilis]|nr:hypothetical protein C8R47DRAFT_1083064 [Mycena vitilis]